MADDRSGKLAKLAFGASFPTDGTLGESIADGTIEQLVNSFEDAAQVDDEGREFWFARDLQRLFGYAKWDNFLTIIQRAKSACTHSGRDCNDHFADAGKMVPLGSGAEREIDDIVLS